VILPSMTSILTSPPPASLRIAAVDGPAALDEFIAVPSAIFASDPAWIQPLALERRLHLSARNNPYFQHARWQAWTAWRDGRAVGRISAQIDALHIERYRDATGFFGMLDAEDSRETFRALLETAERWLGEQGMRRIRGPFNLSINQEMGVLVDGFDTPPYFMMGHARPYYATRIEQAGYRKATDALAYMITQDYGSEAMRRLIAATAHRAKVRPLDLKRLDAELSLLRDIFNDAWAENWGYVPFTDAEFEDLGRAFKFLIDPDMIQIAEVDGEAAAFIVLLPNINEAIRGLHGRLFPLGWAKLLWRLKVRYPVTFRVPLMGVRRKFQRSRLGTALAFLVIEAVRPSLERHGVKELELSWILEDNTGMRSIIESIGGRAYKRYRVYERNLDAL
jgi:GNAT superfamily N-acetyltransferase